MLVKNLRLIKTKILHSHLYLLFISVLLIKLMFFYLLPVNLTPDSDTYLNVSENISLNHCVSRSVPASKECKADWGGNQLLGYPFFLSVTGTVDKHTVHNAIFVQYLLLALAICYLSYRLIYKMNINFKIVFIIAITLSFSPLQVGWSRAILTESLAIPFIIITVAEIICSLKDQKINVLRWSVLLICALFVRYDLIILCLVIPILASLIYPIKVAVNKTIIIGLIVLLPLTLWIIRGVVNDLSFPPKLSMAERHLEYPRGFDKWFKTWADDSTDNPNVYWKVLGAQYTQLKIPERAFDNMSEKKHIETLIENLQQLNGRSIPNNIDNEFYNVAEMRINRDILRYWVVLPLKRLKAMLFDLKYSNNLPIILGSKEGLELNEKVNNISNIEDVLLIIKEYPENTILRGVMVVYKLCLFMVFLIIIFYFQKQHEVGKKLFVTGLSISLSSVIFILLFARSTETRYLVVSLVNLEIILLIMIALWQKNFYTVNNKNLVKA